MTKRFLKLQKGLNGMCALVMGCFRPRPSEPSASACRREVVALLPLPQAAATVQLQQAGSCRTVEDAAAMRDQKETEAAGNTVGQRLLKLEGAAGDVWYDIDLADDERGEKELLLEEKFAKQQQLDNVLLYDTRYMLNKQAHMALELGVPTVTAGQVLISNVLGEGGFGRVLEADIADLWMYGVAVKEQKGKGQVGVNSVVEEASFLKAAQGPSTPALRALLRDENSGAITGIVMGLSSSNLDKFFEHNTQLPLRELVRYMLGMAEAVDHLHLCGICHFDVKLANFFLPGPGQSGHIQLGDFGLAAKADSFGTVICTGKGAGTPTHISPEMLPTNTSPLVSQRADVFSLAVVFDEVLSGRRKTDCIADHIAQRTRAGTVALDLSGLSRRLQRRFASGTDQSLAQLLVHLIKGMSCLDASRRFPAHEVVAFLQHMHASYSSSQSSP